MSPLLFPLSQQVAISVQKIHQFRDAPHWLPPPVPLVSPLYTEEPPMQRCLPLATVPLCLLSAQSNHQCRDASHWLPSLCFSSLHRGTTNAEMPPIGYRPYVSPLCTEEPPMQRCLPLATVPLFLLSAQRNHQCRDASHWLPSLCFSSLHRGTTNAEMPPIGYRPSVSPLCTEEPPMQRCLPLATVPLFLLSAQRNHQCRDASHWLPSLCVSSLHRGTTNAEMPPIGYRPSVSPLCTEEPPMQRCLPLATVPLFLLSLHRGTTNAEMPPIGYRPSVSPLCTEEPPMQRCLPLAIVPLCLLSAQRNHQCRDASHWLPSLCFSSLHRGTTNAEMPPIGYRPSVSPLCTEEPPMQRCLPLAIVPLFLLSAQRNHQCRDASHWLPSLCFSSLHRGTTNAEMPPIGYRPSVSPLCTEEPPMQRCLPLATVPLFLLSAQRNHQCRDASHWLPSLCFSSLCTEEPPMQRCLPLATVPLFLLSAQRNHQCRDASHWLSSLCVSSLHRGTTNAEMPPIGYRPSVSPLCTEEPPMQRCLPLATVPLFLLSAQRNHQCRDASHWLPSLCFSSLHRGTTNASHWLPSLCFSSLHRGTTNAKMPPIGYRPSVSPLCTEEPPMQRCLPLATVPLCLLSAQRNHQCRDASHWLPSLCFSSLHRGTTNAEMPPIGYHPSCVCSLHTGVMNAEMPPIGYRHSVSPLSTEEPSMQRCLPTTCVPSLPRSHQCRDASHWLPSLCVS